jgi:hypothetical protein
MARWDGFQKNGAAERKPPISSFHIEIIHEFWRDGRHFVAGFVASAAGRRDGNAMRAG